MSKFLIHNKWVIGRERERERIPTPKLPDTPAIHTKLIPLSMLSATNAIKMSKSLIHNKWVIGSVDLFRLTNHNGTNCLITFNYQEPIQNNRWTLPSASSGGPNKNSSGRINNRITHGYASHETPVTNSQIHRKEISRRSRLLPCQDKRSGPGFITFQLHPPPFSSDDYTTNGWWVGSKRVWCK